MEQKGYSRKREVDLDAFKQDQHFVDMDMAGLEDPDQDLEADDGSVEAESRQVTNYILQKARNILHTLDDQAQQSELASLIADYELALGSDDEDLVDEAEEMLVDFLDDLEDQDE